VAFHLIGGAMSGERFFSPFGPLVCDWPFPPFGAMSGELYVALCAAPHVGLQA
jgi:hypothetical protein